MIHDARVLLLLAFLVPASGCEGDDCEAHDRPAVPSFDPATVLPLYDASVNPFDQAIGANPTYHPDSDLLATSLQEQFDDRGMVVSVGEWTVPVYVADSSSPRVDVGLSAPWAPYSTLLDAPMPAWVQQDPSSDGSMAVIDVDAGLEYDFFGFCGGPDGAQASWANLLSRDGAGVFARGLSARGSGFALLNGLIWPHELEAGRIEHALLFTFDLTRAGGPVAPATESDGTGVGGNNLPEGARVQLDPALDIDALGLRPWEATIARAMQEFGMILGDDGGGLELEAISPLSFPEGASVYDGLLDIDEGFAVFSDSFPVSSFRVLAYGAQNPDFGDTSDVEFPDRFE